MTYRGKVINGVVVLESDVAIPDGTEVLVEPTESVRHEEPEQGLSSLFKAAEHAKPTGISDLAINHDHYLYGHPKVTNE